MFPTLWEYSILQATKDIYKWVNIINGETLDESYTWFFSEEDATNACPGYVTREGFTLLREEYVVPDAQKLLNHCYMYLFDKAVLKRASKYCSGCYDDHPSQTQHVQGCLMPTERAREFFGSDVRSAMQEEDVLRLYGIIREKMKLPPIVELEAEDEMLVFQALPWLEDLDSDGSDMPYILRGLMDSGRFSVTRPLCDCE